MTACSNRRNKPARRFAREFVQIDCWPYEQTDDVITPDEDGDALTLGHSRETFTSPFAVRVFRVPDTDPVVAARMLRKAAAWVIERAGLQCDPSIEEEVAPF